MILEDFSSFLWFFYLFTRFFITFNDFYNFDDPPRKILLRKKIYPSKENLQEILTPPEQKSSGNLEKLVINHKKSWKTTFFERPANCTEHRDQIAFFWPLLTPFFMNFYNFWPRPTPLTYSTPETDLPPDLPPSPK